MNGATLLCSSRTFYKEHILTFFSRGKKSKTHRVSIAEVPQTIEEAILAAIEGFLDQHCPLVPQVISKGWSHAFTVEDARASKDGVNADGSSGFTHYTVHEGNLAQLKLAIAMLQLALQKIEEIVAARPELIWGKISKEESARITGYTAEILDAELHLRCQQAEPDLLPEEEIRWRIYERTRIRRL